MWHLCMELTEQRPQSHLGLPHHVAPWEHQHWNGEAVKQQNLIKTRQSLKDKAAAMESSLKSRIVQCPKCQTLLQEPPPGNPFYECGSCFATLQAKHATQEDLDIRMQQKALLKRMESDKKTKNVSSDDGYRVFHSDSSSEISEKEEQSVSGEGSPSWSPSRWESPHYGPKPGRSSSSHGFQQSQQQQQQKVVPNESLEMAQQQYYTQSAAASRAKHDLPPDKVEALGQNLHRLGVEDNSAPQHTAVSSPERVHGHGGHQQRHSTMRRPRSEEFLAAQDGERHHAPGHHQVQKTVSFNQTVAVAGVSNNKHAVVSSSGDQRSSSLMPPNDVQHHGGSRVSPSVSPLVKGEAGLHVENLQLPGNFDGRSSQHTANGLECQQDLYAAGDIQDYSVSDYASTVGDGDSYQAMVLESHSRPSSGELDSYVVLDHRVTRPGSYQRSASAGRSAALNYGYNKYGAENHDSHQFDGEKSARHQQLEWLQIGASQSVSRVQQRPPQTSSYHMQQQPSHVSFQGFSQSPPQPSHLRPPAGQNGHLVHESNLQGGVTKSGMYPFLPRGDEPPYVNCQQCGQLLSVPSNLPPTKKTYQKLRCGACMKISVFLLVSDDQISALPHSPRRSGVNADFSSAHFPRNSSPPDSAPNGRHAPPSSRAEVDMVLERGHPPISSGGPQRLPPTARNIPRVPSGSKLSALGSAAANGTTNMAQGPVAANGSSNQHQAPNGVSNQYPASNGVSNQHSAANGSLNLHQVVGPTAIRNPHVPHFSEGMSARPAHTSSGMNGEPSVHHVLPRGSSSSDTEGHHVHDGRFPQTSSESENDSPRQRVSQMPAMNAIQNEQFYASSAMTRDHSATQQYSKDGGYSDEGNSTPKSLKGIMKKGSKDLTKTKQGSSINQYRRKVIVNGKNIPDVLVKRAEGLAGPIHPGSYWYDPQAGFWGLSGEPCLGIIPPHIEELNIPISRHCSGGQTGVLVNGRELHKTDFELLVRRGLPTALGTTYTLDIEGRLREATSGTELRSLGALAPKLGQTGRGHGMWVPGNSKVT